MSNTSFDADDYVDCPACHTHMHVSTCRMGYLGNLEHFSCRQCGYTWHRENHPQPCQIVDDADDDEADDDEADDADDEADDEQAESPKYLTFKDADEDGYVSGVVAIPLKSFTDNDYEGILDIMSNALVGHGLLMDISHTMVGCNCHTEEVLIKVTGTCDWKEINDET